ncbi:hypothetical protein GQ600_10468 [Phytophthora cactorum]|nr:hypothetical protein GQ600_10468 [Phytophthora cactorum]
MLQVVLLDSLVHIVDLVRAQQRTETKDTGCEHLRRLRVEHSLGINQEHSNVLARLAFPDKGLLPHPDARRVAFAACSPAESLLSIRLLHVGVALELPFAATGHTFHDPGLPDLRTLVLCTVRLEHASVAGVTTKLLPVRKAPTTEKMATFMSSGTWWKMTRSASSSSMKLVPSSLMLTI